MRLVSATALVTLALAACGGDDSDAAATGAMTGAAGDATVVAPLPWRTVTDTVADTVVVRTVGVTDSAAALRLVEELRIGELEGAEEYSFVDVNFVLPAPGNGVYVWDRGLVALRQYDSSGTFVRRIGRQGGGPGEYRSANGIVQLPDGRLVLWDPGNARMNVYDSTGGVLESWRYQSTLGITMPWGLLTDTAGNVYARHHFRPAGVGRRTLMLSDLPAGYRVLGPDGVLHDSVLPPPQLPRATQIATPIEGGGGIEAAVPFAPQPAWTVSRFGYVVTGVGDRYSITLQRLGRPLRIERDLEPVPVDPDEKANAREIATAEMRQVNPSWRWDGPPIPDVKPLFSDVRPAGDGRLWVQREVHGEPMEPEETSSPGPLIPPREGSVGRSRIPSRRWREPIVFDVFASDGHFLGTVTVPERARVLHMRGDHVWGVELDEVDVPQVVRWRIAPSLAARERLQ